MAGKKGILARLKSAMAQAILRRLPDEEVIGYAQDCLELTTYDAAMEAAAEAGQLRRECYD